MLLFKKNSARKEIFFFLWIVSIERVELFSNLNKRHHDRKNVYTAQTLPSDCRMLVLHLDTLLFGEKVCVHYNLGNSCYISTKELLPRIEVRSVECLMDKGQQFMVYFTIFNHDTEWASILISHVFICW